MSVKILRPGNINPPIELTCPKCGCVFTCDKEDFISRSLDNCRASSTADIDHRYLSCPTEECNVRFEATFTNYRMCNVISKLDDEILTFRDK